MKALQAGSGTGGPPRHRSATIEATARDAGIFRLFWVVFIPSRSARVVRLGAWSQVVNTGSRYDIVAKCTAGGNSVRLGSGNIGSGSFGSGYDYRRSSFHETQRQIQNSKCGSRERATYSTADREIGIKCIQDPE